MAKREFTRQPVDRFLYKWKPENFSPNKKKKRDELLKQGKDSSNFCNAVAGSEGEDFKTTFVYRREFDGTTERRYAYVACDYVE